MSSRPSIDTSRESVTSTRAQNGKLVKRNPGQVHFAPPTSDRPTNHSSTSLSHYQLHRHSRSADRTREHSRSRSPSRSRTRSRLHEIVIESDSDEDDTIVFTPYAPRRARTPDSSHGPRTPPSAGFAASTPALVVPAKSSDLPFPTRSAATMPAPIAQMRLACVTSTDILNVLHMQDTTSGRQPEPIVPFPYTVHWPEIPSSPPLSPPLTPPAPEKTVEDEPPKQQVEPVKPDTVKVIPDKPAAKRKAWSQAPLPKRSSSQPRSGRKNSFLNWVHPHPPVAFPPSEETPLVIPISPLPMSPIEVIIPEELKPTLAIDPVTSGSARVEDNGSAPLADPASAESEPRVDVAEEEPASSASSLTLLAPPRPTHGRSRSEPIASVSAIEALSTESTGLAAAVATPTALPTPTSAQVPEPAKPVVVVVAPPPAPRKLQKKKKRASAPPGTLNTTAASRPGTVSPLSVVSTAPTTKSTFSFGSGSSSSKTVVASSPEQLSPVTIGPVPPRKKRVSSLGLFSSSSNKGEQSTANKGEQTKVQDAPASIGETLARKRNMSTPLLTPPTTPRDSLGQPDIVVTPPTAPTSADESRKPKHPLPEHPLPTHRLSLDGAIASLGKKKEKEKENASASTQGKPKPKHRRLASLFGGSSSTTPTAITAAASTPTLIRLDSPPPASRPVRTIVRTNERDNVKLWPVPGSSAPLPEPRPISESSSAPSTPRSEGGLQPSSDVAAWGRASTLSLTMTLLMGSGSAARTTRRLRKADGVVREPKVEQEIVVDESEKLPAEPDLHRWRARSISTPSLLLAPTPSVPTPELGALLRAFEDDANDTDSGSESDDSEFGDGLAPRAGARVSFADNASTRREAILSVVHELRRQRLDGNGLPSSSASTHSSINSSMLLYRPLRARRSSFGAASSLRLQL